MNNNYQSNSDRCNSHLILKDYKKRVKRQERYYLYERDKRRLIKCKGKVIKFDDSYIFDIKAESVDEIIRKQHMHQALMSALKELTDFEQQIIDECFFTDKKTYTELSKSHNISRQAYTKKLHRILKKLRTLIESYYEDF